MCTLRLCVVAALALTLSSTALAQAPSADTARAKELFDNGALLYDEGNYQAAILAFQESYNLSKAPVLLYNIANGYERLGDLKAARDTLNTYRAVAPAEERAALERRIANLEERLAAPVAAPVVAAPVVAAPVAPPAASPASSDVATVAAKPGAGRKALKRGLVIGGAVVTAAGVGLGASGYMGASAAITDLDRDAYDAAKLRNAVGYGVSGLGLVGVGVGLALPRHPSAQLSLAPVAGGLRWTLTSTW